MTTPPPSRTMCLMRVLVVDDEPKLADLLRRWLREAGIIADTRLRRARRAPAGTRAAKAGRAPATYAAPLDRAALARVSAVAGTGRGTSTRRLRHRGRWGRASESDGSSTLPRPCPRRATRDPCPRDEGARPRFRRRSEPRSAASHRAKVC